MPKRQQAREWLKAATPHKYDWTRAEDSLLNTFGVDNNVLRDWNAVR